MVVKHSKVLMGESLPFVIDDDSESQQSKPRHTKTKVSDILQNADDNEQEINKSQRRGAQFKALFYRRWIGIKRSIVAVIINILITLVVSCLAIIVMILMDISSPDDHYVFGYENISVHLTGNSWGGLALNNGTLRSYINGCINHQNWHYSIGAYGVEKGIPGPYYLKFVALYAKINSLDMITCISCKICRKIFLNPNIFLFVFILV